MVTVNISTRVFPFADEDYIYRVADITLKELSLKDVGLTVSLIGNHQIKMLNRQYRNVDAPTDVLSFSSGEVDPETENLYLGDIAISFPKVREQAKQAGQSARDELALMIVHGILHLHGYDHDTEEAELAMFSLQEEILRKIRLKTSPVKSESLVRSFRFAIQGILSAFRSERNMWIHLSAALLVVFMGVVLRINHLEWGLIIFSIALVVTTEMVNTTMEYLVNLLKEERHEMVRRIKDISAAAVLIATLSAVIIGLIVFLPKILAFL